MKLGGGVTPNKEEELKKKKHFRLFPIHIFNFDVRL